MTVGSVFHNLGIYELRQGKFYDVVFSGNYMYIK